MIFNRSILAGACEMARGEKNTILLAHTGEVVVSNKYSLFVAEPSNKDVVNALAFTDKGTMAEDAAISFVQIADLVKAMPVDRMFSGILEHCLITSAGPGEFNVSFNDAKGTTKKIIRGIKPSADLLAWRSDLLSLGNQSPGLIPFVYNRERLETAVKAIAYACKYKGKFHFVDQSVFEHGYVWKCQNELTAQWIVIKWVLPVLQERPKYSAWAQNIFQHRSMT